jgi:arsenate reductase
MRIDLKLLSPNLVHFLKYKLVSLQKKCYKMIQVYHNNLCEKSRNCLAFLEVSKIAFEVVDYLNDAPTYEELRALVKKLGIKPIELIRQKEALWKTKYAGKKLAPAQILRAMAKHPILIERPIVVNGDKAVIARPIEKALTVI